MTKQEFIDKYGGALVKFDSYYKYTFNFRGQLPEGKIIVVGYGGNSDDIYRFSVGVDCAETVLSLSPKEGSVYDGDRLVDSFYDY